MEWPTVQYTLNLFARTAEDGEPDHHSRSWSYRDMRRVQGEIDRLRSVVGRQRREIEKLTKENERMAFLLTPS